MPIIAIGLSHRTSPVEVREKFAFEEAEIPAILEELRRRGLVTEGVIVSTCNRMEIYAVTAGSDREALENIRTFLVEHRRYEQKLNGELYLYSEPNSLEHLFKVACGMDSMLLGETEILGQLKRAYELAFQHKHTGSRLNKAFQRAFNVAKHIRTSTNIQRGSVSVASAAVELAEKIFSNLDEHHVMVIGAGDTSEKTARALLSRGAKSLIVSNRSFDRAATLANELGGRAVSFDDWTTEFQNIDIAISSTAAPHYVLDREKLEPIMKARRNRPLLLIDIAVPRDIDPQVNFLEAVYLYNIDDLQAIADNYMKQRQEEIVKCEAIIREKAQALLDATGAGLTFSPKLAQA
ncbi:MAG: glutamyl-tRNA reductase [Limisphaerales bacterium]